MDLRITDTESTNFDTLLRAARNGDLALITTTEAATGERAVLIAAIATDGEDYHISPLARLIDGNPYELFNPPTSEVNA